MRLAALCIPTKVHVARLLRTIIVHALLSCRAHKCMTPSCPTNLFFSSPRVSPTCALVLKSRLCVGYFHALGRIQGMIVLLSFCWFSDVQNYENNFCCYGSVRPPSSIILPNSSFFLQAFFSAVFDFSERSLPSQASPRMVTPPTKYSQTIKFFKGGGNTR